MIDSVKRDGWPWPRERNRPTRLRELYVSLYTSKSREARSYVTRKVQQAPNFRELGTRLAAKV